MKLFKKVHRRGAWRERIICHCGTSTSFPTEPCDTCGCRDQFRREVGRWTWFDTTFLGITVHRGNACLTLEETRVWEPWTKCDKEV